jgi:NAD(P)-dependent dehydrogenase (short-subunit alcohol dehydrogenase family)
MAGHVSVICGASGGLGPAVLAALAPWGEARVGVASERSDPERLFAIDPAVHWERADLADPESVAALWQRIDRIGSVRRLVNVTGGFAGGQFLDTGAELLRAMLDVNLQTAWLSSREAAQRMVAAGGGVIVNVGARAALSLDPGSAAYTVAKAALLAFTRVLSAELSGFGVRVNAVIPGTIDTAANPTWMRPREIATAVSPEEVARVIATLCDETKTAGVSGALIPVLRTSARTGA